MKLPRQAHSVDRKIGSLAAGASQGGVRVAASNIYDLFNMMPMASSAIGTILSR
jgi:hypothetical protein